MWPKTYSYLKNNNNEDKKRQNTQKNVIKRKLKFEGYKHCFKATQLKGNHKELIKNNKLVLKSELRFRRERINVLTEKVDKITLSTNDGKRIQSIDLTETYAYGLRKDLKIKKID